MGWIWLDDLMPENPKVLRVGHVSAWLHICAIAYSNRNKTDGFLPAAKVAGLADIPRPQQAVARLVDAGLWHDTDGGYAIHDYADYQLTGAEREKRRKAGKLGAERRWGTSGNGHRPAMGGAKA